MIEKKPEKSFEMERADPGTFESGDLVKIIDEAGQTPENAPTYRIICGMIQGNQHLAWIGPSTLSSREIRRFKAELKMGFPHSPLYPGCISVEATRLKKVLDS